MSPTSGWTGRWSSWRSRSTLGSTAAARRRRGGHPRPPRQLSDSCGSHCSCCSSPSCCRTCCCHTGRPSWWRWSVAMRSLKKKERKKNLSLLRCMLFSAQVHLSPLCPGQMQENPVFGMSNQIFSHFESCFYDVVYALFWQI